MPIILQLWMSSPLSGECPLTHVSVPSHKSVSRFSEVVEKFPALRPSITEHLIRTLPEIKSGKVYRGILWILGEYVESVKEIVDTFQVVRKILGEIPILAAEQRLLDETTVQDEDKREGDEKKESVTTRPKVLADGTYATETAYSSTASARLEAVQAADKPPLRCKPCLQLTLHVDSRLFL